MCLLITLVKEEKALEALNWVCGGFFKNLFQFVNRYFVLLHCFYVFIEAVFVFFEPLRHTASSILTTICFFPCVLLKFPTHFTVSLNDLIICLHVSKTDFDPRNSFPWKPKGDSIKAASKLRWGIKRKKRSAGIN